AFGANCLKRENVLRRDPVLEATWAAGVRRDVAADRRALERGGVGRIEEPYANRRSLEIDRPRAGSYRDAEVVAIDRMDPVEPLEAERDPPEARDCAAGEPGQAAHGHDRAAQPTGAAE